MGLFNFGKRSETFLTVVTYEGPGRLRLNGVRARDAKAKKAASGHERTVCWAEFSTDGGLVDKGMGRASTQAGGADRLLHDLPANSTCRAVLDRLREGQESVGKWLQLGEPASR
jgi:hypothetical protein